MKLLLVVFGLFATAWATSPVTPTVIDKISACLNVAGVVSIPQIPLNVNIDLLGLVVLYVDATVDCSTIALDVDLALETAYNETTSGNDVSFSLGLEVALTVDLQLDASLTVKLLGLIQLGVGTCAVVYADVVIIIDVNGTFPVGVPSECQLQSVGCTCTNSGSTVTSSGDSVVGSAVSTLGKDLDSSCFDGMENTLNVVLTAGLL